MLTFFISFNGYSQEFREECEIDLFEKSKKTDCEIQEGINRKVRREFKNGYVYVIATNIYTGKTAYIKYGQLTLEDDSCIGIYEEYTRTIYIIRFEDGLEIEIYDGACVDS